MISKEQARQIGCVVRKLKMLLEERFKGSLTVNFDGGGQIGQQWHEEFYELRDKYSSEKRGIPLAEDEFIALITKQ